MTNAEQDQLIIDAYYAVRAVVAREAEIAEAEMDRDNWRETGRTRRSWGATIHNLSRALNGLYDDAHDKLTAARHAGLLTFTPQELGGDPQGLMLRLDHEHGEVILRHNERTEVHA